MKATIIGGNFIGKGAEAMLTVTVDSLRKRIPNLTFRLFGTSEAQVPAWAKNFMQEYCIECFGIKERTVYDYLFLPVTRPLHLSHRYYSSFNQSIHGSEALLDIRGFTFIPDKGIRGANGLGYYIMSSMAQRKDVKHIILPQVMGPMRSVMMKKIASSSLSKAASITVRDRQTKAVLDELSIPHKISVCHDIAFLFEPAAEERAKEILEELGVGGQPFIVITPNIRIYERSQENEKGNIYLSSLVETINFCRDQINLAVLLIPHEVSATRLDDCWLINQILEQIRSQEKIYFLDGNQTAAEVKAIIGLAEMLLGSRYHSLVASLSMGIPSLATSWSHKYEELMQSVNMDEFCLSGTNINAGEIGEKLTLLKEKRDEYRSIILNKVAEFRKEVECLFDAVAEVLKQD